MKKRSFLMTGLVLIVFSYGLYLYMTQEKALSVIRVPIPKEKVEIDPHKMEDMYSMFVNLQVHRGLFYYEPDGSIHSQLVKNWEVSADSKRYLFHLKPATFSDHTPITAQNVEHSLKRLFYMKASISSDLSYIEGVSPQSNEKYIDKISIHAIDENTLEIKLSQPSSLLISHLSITDCAIFKINHYADKVDFNKAPITSSGPYRVREVRTGFLRLELNNPAQYPNATQSIEIVSTAPDAAYTEARKQKLDTLDTYMLSADEKQTLLSEGWQSSLTAVAFENFLMINPKRVDKNNRRILMNAINTQELVDYFKEDHLIPAYGIIPPVLKGYLNKEDVQRPLKSAEPASKVSLEINYSLSNKFYVKVAEYIKSQWEKLGYTVRLSPINIDEYFERLTQKNFQIMLVGKGIDYPDGYSNLAYFVSDVPSNYFLTEDGSLDENIRSLPFIVDLEKRLLAYKDIQKKLLAQNTFLPLFFGNHQSGFWSPRFKKVPEHPLGFQFLPMELLELK